MKLLYICQMWHQKAGVNLSPVSVILWVCFLIPNGETKKITFVMWYLFKTILRWTSQNSVDRVVLAPKTGVSRAVGMLKNDKITYATTYASVLVQLTSVSSSIVFACFTF